MSPTLFSLNTEELAARMRRLNAGVRVGNDRIGALLYADDVEVMSELADESTGCSRWLWERLWS